MTRINLTRGTSARMSSPSRALFTVRPNEKFPPELWHRFRAVVTSRGEQWVDVLRGLIERYLHEHENKTT